MHPCSLDTPMVLLRRSQRRRGNWRSISAMINAGLAPTSTPSSPTQYIGVGTGGRPRVIAASITHTHIHTHIMRRSNDGRVKLRRLRANCPSIDVTSTATVVRWVRFLGCAFPALSLSLPLCLSGLFCFKQLVSPSCYKRLRRLLDCAHMGVETTRDADDLPLPSPPAIL